MCVTITTTLNATPATTGFASQLIALRALPEPKTASNIHFGIANKTKGGMKYESTMC